MPSVNHHLILGLGNLVWDRALFLEEYPREDTRSRITDLREGPGGETATALRALARWGVRTRLLGCVGDDETGRQMRAWLEREGVDASGLRVRSGTSTRQSFLLVRSSAQTRTILTTPPEVLALTEEDVAEEVLEGVALLHLDGTHPRAAMALARRARERGIPVMLDLSRTTEETAAMVGLADLLVADAETACAVKGRRDAEGAVEALAKGAGRRLTAVTAGVEGAWAVDAEGRAWHQPAFPITVVDSTGAGDVFHGAVDYAVVAGMSLREGMRFAAAAAALACTRQLNSDGFPGLEEIGEMFQGS